MAAEKEQIMAELERYRADATTEIVDGREFTVVRIPDRYAFGKPSEGE